MSPDPPDCSSDPCWNLYGFWLWTALNSRLGVTLIGVVAAAMLALWYQRRNKIMEFRATGLRDAAAVYFKSMERAIGRKQPSSPATSSRSGQDVNITIQGVGSGKELWLTEGAALEAWIKQFFSEDTSERWRAVTKHLLDAIAAEGPSKIDEALGFARKAYTDFIVRAGNEIGTPPAFPRWITLNYWREKAKPGKGR